MEIIEIQITMIEAKIIMEREEIGMIAIIINKEIKIKIKIKRGFKAIKISKGRPMGNLVEEDMVKMDFEKEILKQGGVEEEEETEVEEEVVEEGSLETITIKTEI